MKFLSETVFILFLLVGTNIAFGSDTSPKIIQNTQTIDTYPGWNISSQSAIIIPTQVCIYKPLDSFMDSRLTDVILKQVQTHKVSVKIVSLIDQKKNQGHDCKHIISIDRAINQNSRFTERTTKYIISGENAVVFTYKTTAPMSAYGTPNTPMTNISCMVQAHEHKYFDDYDISDSGYLHTLHPTCNPYELINYDRIGELSPTVIQNSVDKILEFWK